MLFVAKVRKALALWALPTLLLCAIIGGLSLERRLPARGAGDPAARAAIGRLIRAKEPTFRRKALKKFPGDTWSQGDHFGRQELNFVREMSRTHDMRPGAVLDAIDRDVKAWPGEERGHVPPCMPRPYYL